MLRSSSINKLFKNLLLSINVAKNNEISISSNVDCKDKTIKKSLFKILNEAMDYLIHNAK